MVLECPYESLFDGNLKSLHYFGAFAGDETGNGTRPLLEGNLRMVHYDARCGPQSCTRVVDDIPWL